MVTSNEVRIADREKKGYLARLIIPVKSRCLAWGAIVSIMSGCTMVGPDFIRPEVQMLDDWNETQQAELKTGEIDFSTWWRTFNDPVLEQLIEKAYQQNLSLQIAGIRIYEARAQLGIIVGSLYPQQQSASGSLSSSKLSQNTESSYLDPDFNALSIGFDATWELDVWGKYRRSVQSGLANLEATVASYDNILVSLTAEVARTYIAMRTLEQRLVVARTNIEMQKESLRIANIQFKEGVVSELDVSQAQMLLSDTKALVPQLESDLRQSQNALAILLGVLPGELQEMLAGPPKIPASVESVILDIPSNLLRRRPDIRLSESRLAAQSPQIGIAKSNLYPQFFLFGTIGWRSTDTTTDYSDNSLNDLFSNNSLFWSAGPSFNWDILNYGRIRNRVRVEDARFQQLVVSYKNTVLNAQREVENAIVAFTRSKEEERFLKESVAAAKRSVDISSIQYREGTVGYQRVLDSQSFLATQGDRLAAVSGQVGTNLVATYKALGGGWQIRKNGGIISEKNKNEMRERTSWGLLLNPEDLKAEDENQSRPSDWRQPDW
jgi:NodT family efflux transporter outer membrane factor (OMF) lipoprotein